MIQNKKNIWIINQYAGSPYYGMNYRSYYLAKEFVKQGYSVTIFAGSYSHLFINIPKTEGMFTKEIIDGINYVWIRTPKYRSSKSIGRIWNMLIFTCKLFFVKLFKFDKPDNIIISSLSILPVVNAYLWSKIFKIKFIFEVRDIWPLTLIEVGNISRYHPLVIFLGWFEKLGYKKAEYIVSLLPNAKDHMLTRGMTEKKFRYIPNGINIDEVENYEEVSDSIKQLLPKDKFIVGYVGTIGIANALEYLVEAAKKLVGYPQIHFIIVGKGGEKTKLQEYCVLHELTNVTFLEPILKIQVQSMLKLFDICYIGWHDKKIYQYGVSANKIFDYMYSAKPILHSININNDIVNEVQCGMTINAEDSLAIKNAILELSHENKHQLVEMGKNGKDYVLQYHSYDALTNIYINLL